nr:lectin domain containing protein [uncultured Mediterranean phage uvMED]
MSIIGSNVLAGASGGAGAATGYQIQRSLRFNQSDAASLSKNFSSAGNRKTWTWSSWVKLSSVEYQNLFANLTGNTNGLYVYWDASGYFYITDYNLTGGVNLASTRLFRDLGAFYHIVISFDTTQATAANRVKMYVNGVQETLTGGQPNQNIDGQWNQGSRLHYIGRQTNSISNYTLDAYLADVHFIDGQALAPTDFGEFDDNNVWQPKEFSGTYGPLVDQSQTWTTNVTNQHSTYTASQAFSGTISGSSVWGNNGSPSVLTLDSALDISGKTVVVYGGALSGANQILINDRSITGWPTSTNSLTPLDITSQLSGDTTLTSIEVRASTAFFQGIKVGDKLLVNSGISLVDNSFHLDFSDNSSNAALGTDSSGQNNTWTVNNLTAESVKSLPGVAFDGNDYLSLATTSDFAFGTSDFTVEYWIYVNTLPSAGAAAYVTDFRGANSSNFTFGLIHHGGGLKTYSWGNSTDVVGSTALTLKTWIHVAHVRSGSTVTTYANGSSVSTMTNAYNQSNAGVVIGARHTGSQEFVTGYISNLRIVKGTAVYSSSFTPSTSLTNITNTVFLGCKSSSSVTTAVVTPGTITANGDPTAGTFNDSTAANDSLVDTPTNYGDDTGAGGEVRGNYATFNPLSIRVNGGTMTNGNLTLSASGSQYIEGKSTIDVLKYNNYCELTITGGNSNTDGGFGIGDHDAWVAGGAGSYITYRENGAIISYPGNTTVATVNSWTQGDVLGMAVDSTNIKFYKNGSLQGTYSHGKSGTFFAHVLNLASNSTAVMDANFGQRPFAYAAPSGYKALCTQNLPEPTIADGSVYMDVKTYTANASNQTVSGLAFSPDLIWTKSRGANASHSLWDTVRGVNKYLGSNLTTSEVAANDGLNAFTSDGFTLGFNENSNYYNGNGAVAWAWDAGANSSKTYAVTVVSDSGNKYRFDGHGTSAVTLDLEEGSTYTFDQSDSSNAGHPLRFSTTSNGTHGGGSEYTTGVTTVGTPGSAGAYTRITIASGAPTLYYYCTQHSGMGGQVNTNSTAGATVLSGSLTSVVYNQSQTWSTVASITTGSAYSGRGLDKLFNGVINNNDPPATAFFEQGSSGLVVTFSSAITATSSIKMWIGSYSGYTTGELYVNGSNFDVSNVVGNNTAPVLVDLGVTSLTSFGVRGNQNIRFSGLVVDGKLLVDSGVSLAAVPSINSVVRANPSAGFSIATWDASSYATVAHGLNAKPSMIIAKSRSIGYNWVVHHESLGNNSYLQLNTSGGKVDSTNYWGDVNNQTFLGGTPTNYYNNTGEMVAYCFAPVEGYSAMGSYTGNGSADGPFVFTGMRPAFILIKRSSATENWMIIDTARDTYNVGGTHLMPNNSLTEGTSTPVDHLSNGFKLRTSSAAMNASGSSYIYAAFAEHPFHTARAR